MIRFELNGKDVAVTPREGESLLDTLRDRCGVSSTKDGCQPQGQCGCCLALVDGMPKVTCAMPADKADGRTLLTVEGIPTVERELLSDAFVAAAGLQCGFCIPGILLRAYHLVGKTPSPSRDEIARALDVHLCRCTGYVKIIDAVELYAAARRGVALPPLDQSGHVGTSTPRYQGHALALGDRPYVDDLQFPGMLHGAVVMTAHARARIRSIDTTRAAAMPGVVRIATATDVPGQRRYGLLYNDWPGLVAVDEITSCVGDVLAVVVAESEAEARAAAQAVEVAYDVLTPVTDPEEALRPDAPQVNPTHANLLSHSIIRRGDAGAALERSTHVVTGTWRTQRIEHLYLEPESAVAVPRAGGGLRVYTQGQGIFDDRRQIARFLDQSEEQIDVELVPNGGAFGGKEDMSIQAHAALAAHLCGRPVKVTLNREESIRMHPKRHPITMHYTVGCDAEGRLTAVKARMIGDSGAYASVGSKVLERAAGHACGPYRVENVDVEAHAAYTNNPPCGAMRGFGANQAHFAMEGALDLLAEKVGLDGWEIRWRNALAPGDIFSTGQVLEHSVGIRATLQAVKDEYYAAREAGRAVGIGCGIKNCGIGNGAVEWGKVRLVVEADHTVSLYNGYTEMGQGLLTVLIQCACEVTGLPATQFHAKVDSTFQLACGQTTGSRATFFGGRAAREAALKLRVDLDAGLTLGDLVGRVYSADVEDRTSTPLGANVPRPKTHPSFGYATQVVVLDAAGKLDRVIAAHDVGRAINPKLCEGQLEGSIHMGLGYALTEELACDERGWPTTYSLRDIGVLRARDMPEVTVHLVEDHDPDGPFGAKGVGEIGLVPTAGAVAGALAAFDGVRRYVLPMKDSPAARAISVGKPKSRPAGKA